jgi:hypothetical protein
MASRGGEVGTVGFTVETDDASLVPLFFREILVALSRSCASSSIAVLMACLTCKDMEEVVVDGAFGSVFSEGGGFAVVVANDSRLSVVGRKAGYVSTEVVSKSDEREVLVLARELASMDNFETLGVPVLVGGLGGSNFSLIFDWKSGISGRVSTGGARVLRDFACEVARSVWRSV